MLASYPYMFVYRYSANPGTPVPPTPSPAPTVTLTASPATITAGQSATLIWASTGATFCSAPWTASTAPRGSQSVTPAVTTTYAMTCTGEGGSASQSVTVRVTPVGGVRGDLTGDGLVTIADLRVLIKMLIGTVPVDLTKADLTGDGALTLADLRTLVQILVGGGG